MIKKMKAAKPWRHEEKEESYGIWDARNGRLKIFVRVNYRSACNMVMDLGKRYFLTHFTPIVIRGGRGGLPQQLSKLKCACNGTKITLKNLGNWRDEVFNEC